MHTPAYLLVSENAVRLRKERRLRDINLGHWSSPL